MDGVDYLTVDKKNQLHWHGDKLQTELRLSFFQKITAALVTLTALLAAIASIADSYISISRTPGAVADQYSGRSQTGAQERVERIAIFSIRFDSGASKLKPESEANLGNAYQVMADNPQATATIRAHTDGTGSADLNRRLAQARAENVRQFLTSRSIDPARIAIKPPAADNPRADNATPAGRAQNRRVEIEIVTVPQPVSAPSS